MNQRMRLAMENEWHRWHGNDVDYPKVSPAFERGFRAAIERMDAECSALREALSELVNERQPLGIDRPAYRQALDLIDE